VGVRGQVLERIRQPNVKLAVWQRSLPDGLGAALLNWARSCEARFDETCSARAEDIARGLEGLAEGPWRNWMIQDLVRLLESFQRIADVSRCRVGFGAG
jgi:hypothetical protein